RPLTKHARIVVLSLPLLQIPTNASLSSSSRLYSSSLRVTAGELIHLSSHKLTLGHAVTEGPPQWALRSNTSDIGPGPFVIAAVDLDLTEAKTRAPLVNYTRAISEFVQPNPQQGSDPHRYVFLVYKESSSFANANKLSSTRPRCQYTSTSAPLRLRPDSENHSEGRSCSLGPVLFERKAEREDIPYRSSIELEVKQSGG
ncbi:hypothetical protein BC827DRAFT_113752, partial [Russula dissimulans]